MQLGAAAPRTRSVLSPKLLKTSLQQPQRSFILHISHHRNHHFNSFLFKPRIGINPIPTRHTFSTKTASSNTPTTKNQNTIIKLTSPPENIGAINSQIFFCTRPINLHNKTNSTITTANKYLNYTDNISHCPNPVYYSRSSPHLKTRILTNFSHCQIKKFISKRRSPVPMSSTHHLTSASGPNSPQSQLDRLYVTHRADVDHIISKLDYNIRLPPQFRKNFLQLGADTSTRDFVTESVRKFSRCFAINWGISFLRTTLAWCMNHTDIIGFLKVGLMHIISAKQLQLLLQHSFTVEQPINSEEFKTFNFAKYIESEHQPGSNILNHSFSHTIQQSQRLQQRRRLDVSDNAASNGSIDQDSSKLSLLPSPSSAHRTKSKLAGSLLGIQLHHSDSDNDENDDGHIRDETTTYEQHKLNLDHIFGLNNTMSGVNQCHDNSGMNNTINTINMAPQDPSHYQTYQQVMFGSTSLPNCPDYLQNEDLLPVRYGSMLDVGAGSGRMAELLSPIFEKIECTEVSEQMIRSIRDKGFVAHHVDNLDQMDQKDKYDVVCLFNLIDRCEEPISLMYQLHSRLRPQLQQHRNQLLQAATSLPLNQHLSNHNVPSSTTHSNTSSTDTTTIPRDDIKPAPYINLNGRVVIAVPLPLRPSVEMTLDDSSKSWRAPRENIAMDKCWCCTSYEESLQHLIMNIIEPCGYDVLTISRLPYLSEGNLHHSHFVLEDVILVCAPKPEWTP